MNISHLTDIISLIVPGIIFFAGYWAAWPLPRMAKDYVGTMIFAVIYMQGVGLIGASFFDWAIDSSWIFGAYGYDCKYVTLCLAGGPLGIWMGRLCKAEEAREGECWPWFFGLH